MIRLSRASNVPGTVALRFAFAFACVLGFLFRSAVASAQSDVGVKAEGAGLSEPLDTGSAVGGQGALASVDGMTGAATANLSFELPRARGRAQPSLALHYNSQRGMTDAGLGWGLDMPSIVRRQLYNAPPDGPPATQIFEYNGRPLVAVCLIDSSGTCDESERQSWASGYTYYRQQVLGGGYERFYLSADQSTWVVLTKSGVVEIFGSYLIGTQGLNPKGAVDVDPKYVAGPSGSPNGGIYRWNLTEAYDLYSVVVTSAPANLSLYVWTHLDDSTSPQQTSTQGLGYLTDIYYTPQHGGQQTAFSSYEYHAHLAHDVTNYAVGPNTVPVWKAVPSRLLSGVDVTTQPNNDTNLGTRVLLRRYHLAYDGSSISDDVNEPNSALYLPELTSFQLEGRCTPDVPEDGATYLLPASTNCQPWPATTMTYEPWYTLPIGSTMTIDGDTHAAFQLSPCIPQNVAFVDLNGDGIADMLEPELPDAIWKGDGTVPTWTNPTHQQRMFLNGAAYPDSPGFELTASFLSDPDSAHSYPGYSTNGHGIPTYWPLSGQILSEGVGATDASGNCVGSTTDPPSGAYPTLAPPAARTFIGDWLANGQASILFSPNPGTFISASCPSGSCFSGGNGNFIASPVQTAGAWSWKYGPAGESAFTSNNVPAFTDNLGATGNSYATRSIPADINGDGTLDSIDVTGGNDVTFNTGSSTTQLRIRLSQRTFPNLITPFVAPSMTYKSEPAGYIPAQFVCGDNGRSGLFDNFENVHAADLNGDGLPDLFSDGKVIFNNGTNFDCATDAAGSNDGHPIIGPGIDWRNVIPGGDSGDQPGIIYDLHDVNGDGRADLFIASAAGIQVYFNRGAVQSTATDPITGATYNTVEFNMQPDYTLSGAGMDAIFLPDTGSVWRLIETASTSAQYFYASIPFAFADMNGSGTDDLVLVARNDARHDEDVAYVEFEHTVDPFNQHTGLMTSITNGYGASTTIRYENQAAMMNEVNFAGQPWTRRSPQTMYAAVEVETKNNIGGDSETDLDTQYTYRDPAYDAWRRQFKGFRDVVSLQRGKRTETMYQIITCQDVPTIASTVTGTNPYPSGTCTTNSDQDELMALPPEPLWQQVSDSSGGLLLRTTNWTYDTSEVVPGIYHSYATQRDTSLWDAGGTSSSTSVVATTWHTLTHGNTQGQSGGLTQNVSVATVAGKSGQHLKVNWTEDDWGNITTSTDHGRVDDSGNTLDQDIVTTSNFIPADRGLVYISSVAGVAARPGVPVDPGRKMVYYHNAAGDVYVAGTDLSGSIALDRFHENSGAVAPSPTPTNSNGLTLVVNVYDANGFLTQTEDGLSRCVKYSSDAYDHFVVARSSSSGGCSAPSGSVTVSTTTSYDRGFQKPSMVTTSSGGLTETTYDPFGRVAAIIEAAPTGFQMPSGTATITVTHSQSTDKHFDIEVSKRSDGAQTIVYRDGLGQAILRMKQSDGSDGITGWVASGAPLMLPGWGVPVAVRKPWVFSGGTADLNNAYAFGDANRTSTPAQGLTYDTVGRLSTGTDFAGAVQFQRTYHSLSIDIADAADLDSSDSINQNTPVTKTWDGHGRLVQTTARPSTSDRINTSYTYEATGEPTTIVRDLNGTVLYKRWMQYDSLGRMVLNAEPNSSANFSRDPATTTGMHAWRYVYDLMGQLLGTSDARGCGENLAYDGLGRLVAEDYSPCTDNQATYSATPEVTYTYDAPIAGETSTDYGSILSLNGHLAAVQDRGAQTVFGYDSRGRTTTVGRNIRTPEVDMTSTVAYDPTRFRKSFAYTEWDTVASETTGAEQPELLGSDGRGQVNYHRSTRDLLTSVDGSYGTLVASSNYDVMEAPTEIVYGDLAATQDVFGYDSSERFQGDTVARNAPSLWTASGTGNYTTPDSSTTQLQLRNDLIAYDSVSNPKTIADNRNTSEWAAGAMPVQRYFGYDALYRLTSTIYDSSHDVQVSPFTWEETNGSAAPIPRSIPANGKRVASQQIAYDALDNVTLSSDDQGMTYDRSLGAPGYTNTSQPNQMTTFGPSGTSYVGYDAAGNVTGMLLSRSGRCAGVGDPCVQAFEYVWDEVGNLGAAARWDFPTDPGSPSSPGGGVAIPESSPSMVVLYTYDASGQRVTRSAIDESLGTSSDSAEIFSTLRLDNVASVPNGAYLQYAPTAATETVLLPGGLGRIVYDPTLPSPTSTGTGATHVFLELPDRLGSASIVIDKETSELVELETYQSYGATDSDYRPARWNHFRESYRFTGKEDDVAVGLTYFGARYFQPNLGRWMSPDPKTVHGLGSNLNPYAYVNNSPTTGVDLLGLDDGGGDDTDSTTGAPVDNGDGTQTTTTTRPGPDPQTLAVTSPIPNQPDAQDNGSLVTGPGDRSPSGGMTYDQWAAADRSTMLGIADAAFGLVRGIATLIGVEQTNPRQWDSWQSAIRSGATDAHGFRVGQLYGTLLTLIGPGGAASVEARVGGFFNETLGALKIGFGATEEGAGMTAVRQLGNEGEAAANISKNTERIASATGTAAYRIPDVLDHGGQVLGEVKNVGRLSNTGQLRDFAAYSQANGYQFQLWVRPTTQLTGPLSVEVANGNILLRFLGP